MPSCSTMKRRFEPSRAAVAWVGWRSLVRSFSQRMAGCAVRIDANKSKRGNAEFTLYSNCLKGGWILPIGYKGERRWNT